MANGLSFLFGGSTQETPESIKRKRELVRAIMGASNSPRNIGEGLNALGDGIVANVLDRRANAAETAGTTAANDIFNSIIGGSATPSATPGATGSAMPKVDAGGNVPPVDLSGNDVYNGFIDTVKTGVTNPYGLAAVAATGKAESGYSPKNANRTWSDPSASGQPGTAGGIMSWRGPRYDALAATGDLSPAGQGKFFLNEDPKLIAALNSAKSVDEAQGLMNRAWAFKGYDRPGGEAGRRLSMANAFLPKFQGQGGGQEVASLDPSAGMPIASPTAPPPVNVPASPSAQGYVDPRVTTDYRPQAAPPPQPDTPIESAKYNATIDAPQQVAIAPQVGPQSAAMPSHASLSGQTPSTSGVPPLPPPVTVSTPPVPPSATLPQQEVAQAQTQGNPLAGIDPRLLKALSNPFINDGQRAVLQSVVQQQLQAQQAAREEQTWRAREDYKLNTQRADPAYQLEQTYKQAQLDALKNKTGKTNLINAGEGNIYDPDTQTWIKAPNAQGQSGDGFRFGGNSVEAQALNGLIDSKQITAGQAQQLAAGKTITGPNGEIIFMTPQGVFQQPGAGQAQPQPQQNQSVELFPEQPQQDQSINLFGSDAPSTPRPIVTSGTGAPAQQEMIPLTAPKAPNEGQANAGGFADRMSNAEETIKQFENQGSDFWQQLGAKVPGGNYTLSPEFQQYDRARRDFINAQLRKESGAVIGDSEFASADKQYFPQPGDSPAVIEDKRKSRELARQGMIRSAGASYKSLSPSPAENPLPPTPAPQGDRPRAKNPQTGETIEFDGTQWVPVQ